MDTDGQQAKKGTDFLDLSVLQGRLTLSSLAPLSSLSLGQTHPEAGWDPESSSDGVSTYAFLGQ